jgi:nitrite reductase/ring-hydroxylating ferredoxin subunit
MENNCMGACESHEHKSGDLSRKAVLGGLAAILTGIGLTSLGDTAAEAATSYKTSVRATTITVGSAKTVTVAGKSILITRPTSTTYRAFRRVCSHEPVTLNSTLRSGKIFCAEHAQSFDPNTGSPTGRGPARRALTKYTASVKNGYVYISI